MAGETLITVVGNLTGDPELRFTPSGAAVANFTIASTPRNFDRQSNEWKDGDTLFMSCSVWRQAAENVAESLTRGMRVVALGRLKARSYETREGEKRTVMELDVEEVGPSMKYATAKVTKATRSGGGGGGFGGDDPWASNQSSGQQAAPQGGSQGGGQQGGWGAPGNQPAPQGGGQGGGQAAAPQGGSWGGQQGGGQSAAPDPWAQGGGSDEPPF